MAFFFVCRTAVAMQNRRKDWFFRPSGAWWEFTRTCYPQLLSPLRGLHPLAFLPMVCFGQPNENARI
jgi:hypothetical protein